MGRPLYTAEDPFCANREPDDRAATVDHFYAPTRAYDANRERSVRGANPHGLPAGFSRPITTRAPRRSTLRSFVIYYITNERASGSFSRGGRFVSLASGFFKPAQWGALFSWGGFL
jgi:hypothetical protein